MYLTAMLLGIIAVNGEALPPHSPERRMEGYDCSESHSSTSIRAASTMEECPKKSGSLQQKNVTYLVLQQAWPRYFHIRSCKKTTTALAFYCGIWDHQTFTPAHSHFHIANRVTAADCYDWWQGLYRDGNWSKSLRVPGITMFQYETHGSTYQGTGYQQATCQGGALYEGKKRFDRITRTLQVEIQLIEEEATADEHDQITLLQRQTPLRGQQCFAPVGYCQEGPETFLWTPPPTRKATCPLYHVQGPVQGIEIRSNESNRTAFFSTDLSGVRVIKGPAVSKCGRIVHRTNYDRLYLTSPIEHRIFWRQLHRKETLVKTPVHQPDNLLYGNLTGRIEREFESLLRQECNQTASTISKQPTDLAMEAKLAKNQETVSLGGGWFATATGEAWHKYLCRPIIGIIRDTGNVCYTNLPVHLLVADRKRYQNNKGENPGYDHRKEKNSTYTVPVEFFLEPFTRLLVTRGTQSPCPPPPGNLWKNQQGQWVQTLPEVQLYPGLLDLPVIQEEDRNDRDLEEGTFPTTWDIRGKETVDAGTSSSKITGTATNYFIPNHGSVGPVQIIADDRDTSRKNGPLKEGNFPVQRWEMWSSVAAAAAIMCLAWILLKPCGHWLVASLTSTFLYPYPCKETSSPGVGGQQRDLEDGDEDPAMPLQGLPDVTRRGSETTDQV